MERTAGPSVHVNFLSASKERMPTRLSYTEINVFAQFLCSVHVIATGLQINGLHGHVRAFIEAVQTLEKTSVCMKNL